jgi:RNA-binding protein 5/10
MYFEDVNSSAQSSSGDLPSTYLYDATSGFYYDTVTGLYYDPTTQYHYNNQTGQYCYYDSTKQTYVPVNSDGTPATANASSKEKKKKDFNTLSGSKTAKKIAKDMERWAKSINTQKQVQQQMIHQIMEKEKIVTEIEQPIEPAVIQDDTVSLVCT